MIDKPFYVRHHDDQWYDEVRLQVIPRYKTSGLSGDEWRISWRIQFLRKGVVLQERVIGRDINAALVVASYMGVDSAPVSDDEGRKFPDENSWCFQPGCQEKAVSEYRLKAEHCSPCGQPMPMGFRDKRRRFCQRHLRRGDAGIDDADANYEILSGPGPDEAQGWHEDESPASFGGIVRVEPEP